MKTFFIGLLFYHLRFTFISFSGKISHNFMKEIPEEIYQYVYSREGSTLGRKTYFAQNESEQPVDLTNWLKMGGMYGEEVTLDKISEIFFLSFSSSWAL